MFRRGGKDRRASATGALYGLGLTLEADDGDLLATALTYLPPAWQAGETGADPLGFTLSHDDAGGYRIQVGEHVIDAGDTLDVFDEFERIIRLHVALHAPDHLFLHAGAVAYRGRGIVIPGASFSGKTSLVAALVRAGAVYYSDETAVIDRDGLLDAYPKPLAIRLTPGRAEQTSHDVSELGGISGDRPIPVGLVVAPQYRPGATWAPTELSPAETVAILMQYTYRSLDRPQQSIETLRLAAASAPGLTGDRGEAEAVAADLLARLAPDDT